MLSTQLLDHRLTKDHREGKCEHLVFSWERGADPPNNQKPMACRFIEDALRSSCTN